MSIGSSCGGFLGSGLRLLEVSSRVGQMTGPSRVPSSHRAFLKVSFQDVTSRERISAENTHVWPIASVCESQVSST